MTPTKIQVNKTIVFITYSLLLMTIACGDNAATDKTATGDSAAVKGTYGYDVHFLDDQGKEVIELESADGQARVLLSAQYQGRVMTSTSSGHGGASYGWINYDLISSGEKKKQFNPVGGEERFWMGPEGGQYSIYFKQGDSFHVSNWQVPAIIDTISYDVVQADRNKAVFARNATLTNYSGTQFPISIQRTVTLLEQSALAAKLGITIPGSVKSVGYETDNQVKNTGNTEWKKENGLLSIWLLCMMTPTPQTTAIVPFHPIPDAKAYITDDYFGEIPAGRLRIKDSVLYFTCDGKKRSKIGLSPAIAKQFAGSFDFARNVLTIIYFPVEKNGLYVNSKWELQKEPYKGDVVNSYNDGPLEDGSQLGPFYELESSSPAKELKPGESLQYKQVTCHFEGDLNALAQMAKQLLGVDLHELKK